MGALLEQRLGVDSEPPDIGTQPTETLARDILGALPEVVGCLSRAELTDAQPTQPQRPAQASSDAVSQSFSPLSMVLWVSSLS